MISKPDKTICETWKKKWILKFIPKSKEPKITGNFEEERGGRGVYWTMEHNPEPRYVCAQVATLYKPNFTLWWEKNRLFNTRCCVTLLIKWKTISHFSKYRSIK